MEFNLDAISSALDEILEYHKDIEQLDTFSSRSESSSRRASHAAAISHTQTNSSAARQADMRHLNDSHWGLSSGGASSLAPADDSTTAGTAARPVPHTHNAILSRPQSNPESPRSTAMVTGAVIAATGSGRTPTLAPGQRPPTVRPRAQASPPPNQALSARPRNHEAVPTMPHGTRPLWFKKRATPSSGEPETTPKVVSTPQRATSSAASPSFLVADLVSASGLGAAALLTRQPNRDGMSPNKTGETDGVIGRIWVTYYAKHVAPYLVVHCPPAAQAETVRLQESAPTARVPGLRVQQTRDLCVTVQLQLTLAEVEVIDADEWGIITVACSRDAKRGFIRTAEVPVQLTHAEPANQPSSPSASPAQIPMVVDVPITLSGPLLASFLKITLTPRHEIVQVTHACRVSRLDLQWAPTWTETRVSEPPLAPPTLQDELDALTRGTERREAAVVSSPPRPQSEVPSAVEAEEEDEELEEEAEKYEDDAEAIVREGGGDRAQRTTRTPQTPATMASDERGSAKGPARVGSYYYDWLHDSFYEGSPSAARPQRPPASLSQASSIGDSAVPSTWQRARADGKRTHGDANRLDCDVSDEIASVAALEVWDASPLWSLAQCLAFGQQQAAFFSVAIAHAQDATRQLSLLNLSALPFAFHICVLRLRHSDDMPALSWLTAINEDLLKMGLQLDLGARVMGSSGFLGVVCEKDRDEAVPGGRGPLFSPRWVLVVPCTSDEDIVTIFQKCYATATHLSPTTAAQPLLLDDDRMNDADVDSDRCCLRIVLDWTRSFDMLLPVLRTWSALVPSIQYYGARQQSLVRHLLPPRDATSDSHQPRTRLPILWSGVELVGAEVAVTLGSFSEDAATSPRTLPGPSAARASQRRMMLASLTITRRQPFVRVWQSRAAPSAPRVVLTNQHVFQSLSVVHGVLAPPAVHQLATAMFSDLDGRASANAFVSRSADRGRGGQMHTPASAATELAADAAHLLSRFVVINEAPWQELQKLMPSPLTSGASEAAHVLYARDRAAATEALTRTTRAFIFHALTTAFRREWRVVGLCLPSCASCLDEDAFMDTILHWDYPHPRAVVVFHPIHTGVREEADATCFSSASLEHFASAASLEESLA